MKMKRMLVTVLVVGCLAGSAWLVASIFTGSKAIAATSPGQRWEYMVVSGDTRFTSGLPVKSMGTDFFDEAVSIERYLDNAGALGWELVAVIGAIGGNAISGPVSGYQEFIFKRPLP